MKKLIFTCLLFLFFSNIVKAQYVTIPDANFRKVLISKYASCFNSNKKMNINCSLILNEDSLDVHSKEIFSVDGIQYFKGLNYFNCYDNFITSLPQLASTISNLNCGKNQLAELPILPSSLETLFCSQNLLNSLPPLPNSIIELFCDENQLNVLPSLPNGFKNLYCNNNKLLSLPLFPESILIIQCDNNELEVLPSLPMKVNLLFCGGNNINSLPMLPSSLIDLFCGYNLLDSLPTLPDLLKTFWCNGNNLKQLPKLPDSLTGLNCSFNKLEKLPTLPKQLTSINCGYNKIDSLPKLPNSIVQVICENNQIKKLPAFPNNLTVFICNNNLLDCLPPIPKSLVNLHITETNIKCLPNLTGNAFYMDTIIPICDDEEDICDIYGKGGGIVYNDLNNNGIFDSLSEIKLENQIISAIPNFMKTVSDLNGNYIIKLETEINNTWSCNSTNKYTTIVPDSYSATPTNLGLLPDNYNFGIRFKPDVKDLEATLAGSAVRPGFTTNIGVTVNNIGTINQTNITIKLKKPAGYNVLSTSTAPTSTLNDTLFWKNVTIDFLDKKSFYVELQVPVSASLGSEIVYEAWVNGTLGDTTPIDNYTKWTEIIRGSFDPNDKLVSKATLPPAYDIEKDRLIYTIRFQNTGTDTAFYVRVKDEIPANLNLSTLKLLNASHAYQLIVREKNIVEFAFPNINLPDKTTNEPKSHGFVQFSIQPKAGLPINTKIENNASIYFDYNAPIITNFAKTEVKLTTGLASNKNLDFKLFPNPTNGTVRIELPYNGDGNWSLSDISGRQLKVNNIANNEKLMELNLNDLPSGTYFITIQLGENISTAKIVKM